MRGRRYSSPAAFKQALEQRLRAASKTGAEFARKRQLLVFDRFLARIVAVLGDAVTLKGGLVLELRLARARTTKDIDLCLKGSPDGVLARLQEAARLDLGDFLTFEVGPDEDHPEIQNDGMQYEGMRFRVESRLAGKPYGQPFGVDIAFGDPMLGEPEVVAAEDVLDFAGIAPPRLRIYPIETHVAEKLHAYTLPRARPNSRVKDLPELALLASAGTQDATRLRMALEISRPRTRRWPGGHMGPMDLDLDACIDAPFPRPLPLPQGRASLGASGSTNALRGRLRARLPRRDGPHRVHRHLHLGEDAARVVQERLPRGQQAHASGRALEEPGAQLLLEREDVAAERWLGEVEPARGSPHVTLLGHRDEGLEVRETHGR
jgi:hypothetical protein